jgi:hypothetical protein
MSKSKIDQTEPTYTYTSDGVVVDTKLLSALVQFTSKDELRASLGVGISTMSGRALLCATDRHTACALDCGGGGLEPLASKSPVWSRAMVEELVRVAKATKSSTVTLPWGCATPDAKFPPIEAVMPKEFKIKSAPIGLNPAYLSRLEAVTSALLGKQRACVLVHAADPLGPVMFEVRGHSCVARVLIMPMRV